MRCSLLFSFFIFFGHFLGMLVFILLNKYACSLVLAGESYLLKFTLPKAFASHIFPLCLKDVVICNSYLSERHMEKNGQILERSGAMIFAIQVCIFIIVDKR